MNNYINCLSRSFFLTKSNIKYINTIKKNVEISIDPVVNRELDEKNLKEFGKINFKNHIGRNNLSPNKIPTDLKYSIEKAIDSFPESNLIEDANKLTNFITDRRVPIEKDEKSNMKKSLIEDFKSDDRIIDPEFIDKHFQKELEIKLKSKIHQWSKINYTSRMTILYMMTRFEQEYSIINQILKEIDRKDNDFKPSNVFDFGSGLGTVMWATNHLWGKKIDEYFNCDTSREMNQLSDLILRGGSIDKNHKIKNVKYLNNLPMSMQEEFDLVTSCFSLFEMPNRLTRFQILENLWGKVKENGYFIIAEIGTKHGFKLITEARNFILTELSKETELDLKQVSDNFKQPKIIPNAPNIQIFSPCPHSKLCPILEEGRPCNFKASYWPSNFKTQKMIYNKNTTSYSYLVIKKSDAKPKSLQWPRIVIRNPEKKGNATHSWICSAAGDIDHLVSSRNRCKKTSRLLKYSKLGDNLPIDYEK